MCTARRAHLEFAADTLSSRLRADQQSQCPICKEYGEPNIGPKTLAQRGGQALAELAMVRRANRAYASDVPYEVRQGSLRGPTMTKMEAREMGAVLPPFWLDHCANHIRTPCMKDRPLLWSKGQPAAAGV
eukprot:scaffold166489_cov33-Tisochrysis_lutea.AAC.2